MELEFCPNCRYTLLERSTYCPYCGFQLTYPAWKKAGAWFLLIFIGYVMVTCHLRLMKGL